MNKPKLWTKDFLIISSTNFFIFMIFYLLMVTLSIYTIDQFGATASQSGLASSIFVIGALAVRPFAGKYIELIGKRNMLYGALVLFLVTTLIYFKTDSLAFLLTNRLLHGIAFGFASTATGTIAADVIPNERRGEGTGYFAMSMNLAMATGPFLGLFLSQHGTYNMIFASCVIFAVIAFIPTLFMKFKKVELTQMERDTLKGIKIGDFFEVKALPIAIVMCIVGFSYSSVLTFMTAYSKEMGLVNVASFFFVVFAIFLLASRPFTGRWFDLKGENFVIYPSLLLFGIGMLVLSQANHGFILLAAGALIGVGYGTFQSSAQAIAIKNAPRHKMGLATSTFFVFVDLGIGIGPFTLGFLIPVIGYNGLYMSMALVGFACMFVYYLLHGKKSVGGKQKVHAYK
ncbi:MFS transporter [Peribacillus loiseleuriae]|uniref:Multidrug MFS transporter n=1 Tax=Peribacillus loiseleuriae TaxID=1679170 RepID=A0A0K9GZL2_9BACI|nr:MFS transporter [Peribacillus loiseleuriae]KMY52020.1 multidrug MFS transporter [Peribacillus loiseleuriae]